MTIKGMAQNTVIFNIILSLLVINFSSALGYHLISQASITILLVINIGLVITTLFKKIKIDIIFLILLGLTMVYVFFQIIGISSYPDYTRLFIRVFQLVGLICLYLNTTFLYNLSIIKVDIYKLLNFSVLALLYFSLFSPSYIQNVALLSDVSFAFVAMNFLMYIHKKIKFIYIILFLPLVILGGGRTHLISLVIFVLIYKNWGRFTKNKLTYVALFSGLLFVAYTTSVLYPSLIYNPFFLDLNIKFNQYTGENFFSGRQVIWANILENVKDDRMFGLGSDITSQMLNNLNLSAHNQYLEIYAQSGIVGLVIFVTIIFMIWAIHYKYKSSKYSRFNIAFLSSLMVMGITSVCLYQTNMALASIFWFVLGLGTNNALNDKGP
ncbi:O-antigen ligase family protein [Paenibacillus sp.]|uniref:O-antigen ligase family protein n=1 Tax=Paenibacillus sp. TaxID=58172 RepID=UPI0028117F0C|nr:O-antigen ligase family protein [Paenibacillus sp.]